MTRLTFPMSETDPEAKLEAYLHTKSDVEADVPPRRAVIVCPGGGYDILCPREGEPVALKFFAAGFQAFVLSYSLREKAANYAPAIEAATAVRTVREHAEEWGIRPDRIFILGFSAGGHVAGSCGVLWDAPAVREALADAPRGIGRPDEMILCYPVISDEAWGHRWSILRCTGQDASPEATAAFSLEKQVTDSCPPAFLFHCQNDDCVPVRNTFAFAEVLGEHNIPCETHVFHNGAHGIGLCDADTSGTGFAYENPLPWSDLAVAWAKQL